MDKILKEEDKIRKALEERRRAKKASADLLSVIRAYHTGHLITRQGSSSVIPRTISSTETFKEVELNLTPFEDTRPSTRSNGENGLKRLSSTDLMSNSGLPTTNSEAEMMREILFWSRTMTRRMTKMLNKFDATNTSGNGSLQRAYEEITRGNTAESVKKTKTKKKRVRIMGKVTTIPPTKTELFANVPSLKEYFAVRDNKLEGSKFQTPLPALTPTWTSASRSLPLRRMSVAKSKLESKLTTNLEVKPPWNPCYKVELPPKLDSLIKPGLRPKSRGSSIPWDNFRPRLNTPKRSIRKVRNSLRMSQIHQKVRILPTVSGVSERTSRVVKPRQHVPITHIPRKPLSRPSTRSSKRPNFAYTNRKDQFPQPQPRHFEKSRTTEPKTATATTTASGNDDRTQTSVSEKSKLVKQETNEEFDDLSMFFGKSDELPGTPPNTRANVPSSPGLSPQRTDEADQPKIRKHKKVKSKPLYSPSVLQIETKYSSEEDNVLLLLTKKEPLLLDNVTLPVNTIDVVDTPIPTTTPQVTKSVSLEFIVSPPRIKRSIQILQKFRGVLSSINSRDITSVILPPKIQSTTLTPKPLTDSVKKLFSRKWSSMVEVETLPTGLEGHNKDELPDILDSVSELEVPTTPATDSTKRKSRFGWIWEKFRKLKPDRVAPKNN